MLAPIHPIPPILLPVKPTVLEEPAYCKEQDRRLCGLHALNHLAQGPLFTREHLDALAQFLTLLQTHNFGMTVDPGTHADKSGNYHSLVLDKSLKDYGLRTQFWGELTMAAVRAALLLADTFIINVNSHWTLA